LQLIFYDFFFTDGFASIFKLFILLFGRFEDRLMETRELKSFIECFNKELDFFKDFSWLKSQMSGFYMHLELFTKVRNSLIGEKEESIQKLQAGALSGEQCFHDLPYCFAARAARSLKGENFQIKIDDLVEGLTADRLSLNKVQSPTNELPELKNQSKLDWPPLLRAIKSLGGDPEHSLGPLEVPEPLGRSNTTPANDFLYIINEPAPAFTKISGVFVKPVENKSLLPDGLLPMRPLRNTTVAPGLRVSEDCLPTVRCQHICSKTPDDYQLAFEKDKKMHLFFQQSNRLLFDVLGPQIEGLLAPTAGRTMKIMKNILDLEPHPALEGTKGSGMDFRLRTKSLFVVRTEIVSPMAHSEVTDGFRNNLHNSHRKLSLAENKFRDSMGAKLSLDEFKVEEFFNRYRIPGNKHQENGSNGVSLVDDGKLPG